VVDTKNAVYQAGEEDAHVDYALRWSHTIEDYDLGLSWFNGTSRDPLFKPASFVSVGPGPLDVMPTKLAPYYAQINQLGIDLQATLDSWLWKFEAIYRSYDDSVKNAFASTGQEVEDYTALTGGFEYTFYGPLETVWDWGVLAEYQYDSREDGAVAIGQNDFFAGSRIAFNDEASSEILAGMSQDLDHSDSRSFVVEYATRLNEGLKFTIDAFLPMSEDENNLSTQFKNDDYVQLSLNYYY
jgi:hypothetical protein